MWNRVKWALGLAAIPIVVAYGACTLDQVDEPQVAGPSELAASLEMRAIPDQLTADGFSSSVIEAVYRDENGRRTAGQTILFDILAGGVFLDLGNLSALDGPRPVAGGPEAGPVSAVTDGDGVARVRYWAPFRTDQENDITVTITGRPQGTDFRAAIFRQVDIFLRAANRPSFPGTSTCGILVEPQDNEYAVGDLIFFTATQITGAGGNPIARYEWDFGDTTPRREGRNVEHAFTTTGTFTVTLFTTESITGAQDSCTVEIEVTATGGPPPAPPTPTTCPTPTASLALSQLCDTGEILAGTPVLGDGIASSAGAGETIASYRWNWGDGTVETTTTPTNTHTYAGALAGLNVTIQLTVTNSCGATGSTSSTLAVVAACP